MVLPTSILPGPCLQFLVASRRVTPVPTCHALLIFAMRAMSNAYSKPVPGVPQSTFSSISLQAFPLTAAHVTTHSSVSEDRAAVQVARSRG